MFWTEPYAAFSSLYNFCTLTLSDFEKDPTSFYQKIEKKCRASKDSEQLIWYM